ncbi:isocitrate lyase/PEP mutase family protein [Streptomyces sp. WI04-05B]|uniref:isocitrate lyase/PEP mutase family protein n=1 Tax=Streptomyces TaxID=1883 RepID=UPI0029A5404D|nr:MULTISPECIES: isocitrate lyase/phosphoenolpyruvate mutase family protein [unclassified Streptomyces]MDX2548983.1 isocitrate lyase/phosphoenolpyruvate mutase family protein [Streptomyces sp. WI04-05B]MDX2587658.1 isocitrate lyase/phosphoenolpyruvate mutase family protein [Streptomyces sp. WI04-05A]
MTASVSPFAALHHHDQPLLLPNAWDHASAVLLAAQGFAAIGTTSLGVAAAVGLPDGTAVTRDHTLQLALNLGTEDFLLSVDAEGGFSEDPAEVGEFARELSVVGAVGINLEDGLGPAGPHAEKIAAVKAAAPGLFVNARTDTYWLGDPGSPTLARDTMARLDAYRQAGADGLFVPGLTDPRRIAALVRSLDVPLNILYSPTGPTVAQLGDLGVRRVSLGSLLYRRALGAAVEALGDIRAGRVPPGAAPTYDEVVGLGHQRHGSPVKGISRPEPASPGAAPRTPPGV